MDLPSCPQSCAWGYHLLSAEAGLQRGFKETGNWGYSNF
jgi:hypothetical protein